MHVVHQRQELVQPLPRNVVSIADKIYGEWGSLEFPLVLETRDRGFKSLFPDQSYRLCKEPEQRACNEKLSPDRYQNADVCSNGKARGVKK